MPTKVKVSLDELLSRRQGNIRSTPRGDALVKAFKSPPSWDPEARSAKFIMSSETVDRYGDIVRQAGMDTERFEENPQALLFHDTRYWPVGSWSDITKLLTGRPKRTEGVLNFLPAGKDPDSDRAAVHVEHKTIRTVSIGFLPKDWEAITDEDSGYWTGFDFTESELIECSLVPIPAQPDALVKDAGGDPTMLRFLVEEVLDNWVRTPEGVICTRADFEKLYSVTIEKISKPAKPKAQLELAVDAPAIAEAARAGAVAEIAADMAAQRDADDAIAAFLLNAQPGDRIVLAADAEEIEPVLAADGVWRAFKEAPAKRIEIVRDAAIAHIQIIEGLLSAEAVAAIGARQKEVTKVAAPPAPVVQEAPAAPAKPIEVKIVANTAGLESDVSRVGGLLDGIREKLSRMFGLMKTGPSEPIAPVVPVAPTPEAIALAKGRALAVRARVSSKGLI